jgi:uncharacterized DUF497 family protein
MMGYVADLRFDWDERKNASNKKKHGVSFEEAQTVFTDEEALLRPDDEHSEAEDRFVLLGLSLMLQVLILCHCYRQDGDIIRIVSARKANARERAQYRERWRP